MSNVLTGNPWAADTAAVLTTKPLYVKRIVWESPTTNGHSIDLTNNAGHKVFSMVIATGGAGTRIEREIENVVAGLNLVTIQSGTVYIYLT
jgi:hypothetical protein